MEFPSMQRAPFKAILLAVALGLAAGASPSLAQDKKPIRIGYWTSGFSLGFGAVLQEGGFLKAEGMDSEFRSFGEVSAPAQAVLTGDIPGCRPRVRGRPGDAPWGELASAAAPTRPAGVCGGRASDGEAERGG
jgi:NitT/TauT family transport system substrate-binding protein